MDLRGEGAGLGAVIEAVSEEGIRLVKERVVENVEERNEKKKEVKERYARNCLIYLELIVLMWNWSRVGIGLLGKGI
jgi:hypothetical protein